MQESNEIGRDQAVGRRLLTNFAIAEFCLLVGNLMLRVCNRELSLPAWAIALLAFGSTLPMLLFAVKFFRMLRDDADEMFQRVVLEGLAFSMVVFIPLAGLYVNARAAGLISLSLDPPELFLIPSILVAIGVLMSWSRLK